MNQDDVEIDGFCCRVDDKFDVAPKTHVEEAKNKSEVSPSIYSKEIKKTMLIENVSDHSNQAIKRAKTESSGNNCAKATLTTSVQTQGLLREGKKCLNLLTVFPHHIAISGNIELSVKWLLTQIAPYLGVTDNLGDLALNTALQRGEKSDEHIKVALLIAEIMRDSGVDRAFHTINSSGHSTLFTAAGCETDVGMKIIEILLEAKVNISLCDVEGQNVLHHCAQFNYMRSMTCILNHLRKSESNPKLLSICNSEGRAPLHVAILNRHLEMVSLLIEYGADRNQHRQGRGDTPLMEAIERLLSNEGGDIEIEIMKLLLSSDERFRTCPASANLRRFFDRAAPLHLLMLPVKAANNKDRNHPLILEAIVLLCNHGARIKFNDNDDILSEHRNAILAKTSELVTIERELQDLDLDVKINDTCSKDSGLGSSRGCSSQASSPQTSECTTAAAPPVEKDDSLASLPEADIKLINERIGNNWRQVLERLNLKRTDLQFFDIIRDPITQALKMNGKNISRHQFSEVLMAEQFKDLSQFVDDIFLYNEEGDDDENNDDDDDNENDIVVDSD